MDRNMEEKIPQVVEDRLQEAYSKIRRGEAGKMEMAETGRKERAEYKRKQEKGDQYLKKAKQRKRKSSYRSWVSIAAALALIVAVPSAVFAAVVYFQKDAQRDADSITYEFALNYELKPGEYQVTPDYIPEGLQDQGDGKYRGEEEQWITVMPVYTMAELEKLNAQITVGGIDNVEHMELSGMEADIITFPEAKKNQSPTYIFLFNEREGYVLEIIAGYGVGREELLEFAGHLSVERIGDGKYETEEEKALREKGAREEEALALEAEKSREELLALGIPQDKIYKVGEEMRTRDGMLGYTVVDYRFLDGIAGFEEDKFFEYARFDGWLREDKTLLPYTRQYFRDGKLLSEEQAEQEVLQVDLKVHCYAGQETVDAPLNFQLTYVEGKQDGSYTWEEGFYGSVPEEKYYLQMDNSAVYLDKPIHTEGEKRSHFFYRDIESGEDLYYTLLFVVDKDRKEDFMLSPVGSNYSLWQLESETAHEIRDGLDGYIRLE